MILRNHSNERFTQRVLSVAGVADAIHIATYYIGNILIEANERNPTSTMPNSSYKPYSSHHSRNQSYTPRGPPPPHVAYPYSAPPHPQQLQLQEQKIYIPNDLVGCIIGKGGSKINEIRGTSQCTIKIMEPGAPQNAGGGPENERLVVITGAQHNISLAVSMLHHVRDLHVFALIVHANDPHSASNKKSKRSWQLLRLTALARIIEIVQPEAGILSLLSFIFLLS